MTWHFLKLVSSSTAHLDLECRHEKEGKGSSPNETAHWLMLKMRGVTQTGAFLDVKDLMKLAWN